MLSGDGRELLGIVKTAFRNDVVKVRIQGGQEPLILPKYAFLHSQELYDIVEVCLRDNQGLHDIAKVCSQGQPGPASLRTLA